MSWRVIAELAGFQTVWLACALGAAGGSNVAGLSAASAFIGLQLARQCSRPFVLAMLASGLLGLVFETLFASAGILRYAATWPSAQLAPAWIVALWLAFGTTLATTARLLRQRALPKAAVFGAIFGPLSYAAGARLGALDITAPGWIAFGAIAGAWALSFPSLMALQQWLGPDARCEFGSS